VTEQEKLAVVPQQLSFWFKYFTRQTCSGMVCLGCSFKDGPAQYMHVKQVQYVEAQENNPPVIIISVTIKLYM